MKEKLLKLQNQKKQLKNLAAVLAFSTTVSGCAISNQKDYNETSHISQLIKEISDLQVDVKNLNSIEKLQSIESDSIDFNVITEIASKLNVELKKDEPEVISKKKETFNYSNINNGQKQNVNEELIYGQITVPSIQEVGSPIKDQDNSITDENQDNLEDIIDSEVKHEHNYTWTYDVNGEKGECSCGEIITKQHSFTDWTYNIDNQDVRNCLSCDYEETRNHEHDINEKEKVCKKSNHDGTHELETSYSCSTCGETFTETTTENCNPTITIEMIEPSNFAITNTHNVRSYCDVCKDESVVEQACTPVGDIQYMKYQAQTYEYQICNDCQNRCNQYPHYQHQYGDWIFYDESQHRKECGCGSSFDPVVEDRYLYEKHDISSETGMICSTCGYTKEGVQGHDHATDGMDILDLVLSPFYKDVINTNQIANPYPSADSYCFRYDLRCSTCGIYYSVKQPHHFKDGFCVGDYCGHVADPNYGISTTNEEVDQKTLTLTK